LRLLDLADKGAKAIDTALPEIGASGNISIWGFDEKGHNSVVSDPVSAGGSIVARWGSPSENENLGEVTAGMKHLGIGTNVTDSGMQGVNVHVGVSVGSPVTVSARWDVFKTGAKEMASSVLKFFGSGANYPVY
jgi:hypothetical protein